MAKLPSKRRHFREPSQDLNLTPMMNLIGILIPVLLVSMAFIEIATVNAALASGGDGEAPPNVSLMLQVASGDVTARLSVPDTEPEVHTFVAIEQTVSCARYTDTRPPPRKRNEDRPLCADKDEANPYWTYDLEALGNHLRRIKDRYPSLRTVSVSGDPTTDYEDMVIVLDTARDYEDSGVIRTLFDQVSVTPWLGEAP